MKKNIRCGLIVASLLTAFFASRKIKRRKSIQYGHDKRQNLMVYSPKKTVHKTPVILYIHGGSWSFGDKSNVSEKPALFNEEGYTFISMNHRLSPSATVEEMIEDIISALQWISKKAKKYNMDDTNIILMGHSSGAHLISLFAMDKRYAKQKNYDLRNIRCVVNLEGPVDIEDEVNNHSSYRKVFTDNRAYWLAVSPKSYVKQNNLLPMLIVSKEDPTFEQFIKEGKTVGNQIDFVQTFNTSHRNVTKYIGANKSDEMTYVTKEILTFLQRHVH